MITFDDFLKVDLRVGTIIEVDYFLESIKPAYKLKIDFGKEVGIKKSSAQITALYKKEELIGKQVLCVVNLKPKQIGKYMSEVLTTGFIQENGEVVLTSIDKKVKNGLRLM